MKTFLKLKTFNYENFSKTENFPNIENFYMPKNENF